MDIGTVRRRLIAEPVVVPIPGAEPQREPRERARPDERPAADTVATPNP